MTAAQIARYLGVTRQHIHHLADDLPEHFDVLAADSKHRTVIWAATDIIAWAKANGWVDPDDPREGVALDDTGWNVWQGTRWGKFAHLREEGVA
jgi:hypothetical protein